MTKTCLIISGGDFSMPPEDALGSDIIIACDSGYKHAEKMGVKPHMIVGDFDSAEKPETGDIPIKTFPSRKDDTDTMLAVKHALDEGASYICIACALGGRMDHTFANIQAGAYIANAGAHARITDDNTVIDIFKDKKLVIPKRDGWSFSVFSLADESKGVSISGAKYEIENADVVNTFPWGQSNVWAADQAKISVNDGMLVVIQSKLKPGEHI